MIVPFLDLHAAYKELKPEIDAAVTRVLESGQYILGPEVAAFEGEFAAYCEAQYCVGVASGLDALIVALRSLEVGSGDEVIVPSNTFIATWLAVAVVGATLVPVEPDPETHNIDPSLVAAAITPRTKVLLPVHLYGQPAEMEAIMAIAKAHGLAVIEDAAQAHGARYRTQRIGALSDVVCWSFYPGKNLGAMGDGGAITTDRSEIADRIRVLRNYGSRQKYLNEVRGLNSRLDPVQAAILRTKLPYLDEWNERRRGVAARYLTHLQGAPVVLPFVPDGIEPVWHLFAVRSKQRDVMKAKLAKVGIETLIHYPTAPHLQEAFSDLAFTPSMFPIARQLSNELLSLPIGPHMSSEECDRVIEVVLSVI